jgi:hypothetical protein
MLHAAKTRQLYLDPAYQKVWPPYILASKPFPQNIDTSSTPKAQKDRKGQQVPMVLEVHITLHALAVIPHTGTELVGLNHPALQQQHHMWQQAMQQQLEGLSAVRLVTAAVCMHVGAASNMTSPHPLVETQRQHAFVLAKAQAPHTWSGRFVQPPSGKPTWQHTSWVWKAS